MGYLLFKFIHIAALILWLGPALGAYWFVLMAHRARDPEKIVWVEKYYEQVLRVEHVAFIILLASGLGMVWKLGLQSLRQPWLEKKLLLVGLVTAIEIVDVWISHLFYRRAFQNGGLRPEVWKQFLKRRKVFYRYVIPILAGVIPLMLYFAVFKS